MKHKIIKVLKKGGLVVCPTDTVYGFLADATNIKAVEKLIAFKERPKGKAISIFVSDFKMMKNYVHMDKEQESLLRKLLPGPYTLVLQSKHKVCVELESERGTLGVRIPKYKLLTELLSDFGKPVTATSANLSNQSPHYSIGSFLKGLSKEKKKLIDLIVDVGSIPRNKPSTVIDLTEQNVKVLRQGDLTFSSEKKFISRSERKTKDIAKSIISQSIDKKPLIYIIQGDLGAGKTVFVKGIGEYFGIKNIISPSYVIYYEYKIENGMFYHFDLYNVESNSEFDHLGIDKLLKPENILCFEWGNKTGEIINLLKNKGKVIYIKIEHKGKNSRKIFVQN